jgi:hypothetical protein
MGKNDKKDDKKNVFSKAGKDIAKGSEKAGKDIAKFSEKAGKDIAKFSEKAGKAIATTAQTAGKAIADPCDRAYTEKLQKQLKESNEKIVALTKQITEANAQVQSLTNQIQPLNVLNTQNITRIQLLNKQLADEIDLYNRTYKLYTDALDALKIAVAEKELAEFNQSVFETQTLITDLNQPYVRRGDDLVSMLSKYIPISNADSTYQTIQYREGEFANLKYTNNIINIIYYIGVIFLFVLLFTSNNVYLKERFIFYIFLILLPILYPWIYLYTIKIWTYFFPVKHYSGPKNAFIDEATNQSNVYYN